MAEVIWSKKANRKRIAFLTYGEKEFGRKAAVKMNERIEGYIQTLAGNPYMGIIEPLLYGRRKTYHSLVVHKPVKLIYSVDEATNSIHITDVWDTRREPRTQAGNLTK